MAEDWDLFAVVRSCSSATSNTQKTDTLENNNNNSSSSRNNEREENPLSCLADFSFDEEEEDPFLFPSFPAEPSKESAYCNELQDSYKPFLQLTTTASSSPVSAPTTGSSAVLKQEQELNTAGVRASLTSSSAAFVFRGQGEEQQQQPQVPARSRKRKNQQKRTICHVTQENLSSDMWAWRKYGQKPIKGSPYPRNYYRCSSTKGCLARKQVERSNLDPNIFIVTYTGDHTHPPPTHRNSLAGSTRNRPPPANAQKPDPPHPPPPTQPRENSSPISPATPSKENGDEEVSQEMVEDEEEMEEEDDVLIPNLGAIKNHQDFLFSSMQGLMEKNDFSSWTTAAGGGGSGDGCGGGGGAG